jgi:diadenylate cyclase
VGDRGSQPLTDALALVAPGTPLREGLDRILQANKGALVVVGDQPTVLSLCTGGFLLDAEFTPQRLSELAKMDGAIILAADASRIARANVHLVPKASVPTSETGTRHRTAERVARSIDVPVITVSEAMSTIAVYRNDQKHTLQPTGRLVDRASQALSTLQRFRSRYDLALATLTTLEIEDTVSAADVVAVLQPAEMVVRIGEELDEHLVELGEDGRMYELQLEELAAGVEEALRLVVRDYVVDAPPPANKSGGANPQPDGKAAKRLSVTEARARQVSRALKGLHHLSADALLDPTPIAGTLGLGDLPDGLDSGLECRGYRLLHRVPRVSDTIIDRMVERYETLPGIMQASLADLEKVEGVGTAKARAVKESLARMAEASILERYE